MNTNTEIKTWQERCNAGECNSFREGMKCEITDLRAEIARLQAALAVAQSDLEDWRFTNGIDELERENNRLRAALADRDAKQGSSLYECVQAELPPMPEPHSVRNSDENLPQHDWYAFDADQMQAYARAALAQRVGSWEPVGYVFGNSYWEEGNPRLTDDVRKLGKPLYTTPPAVVVDADKRDAERVFTYKNQPNNVEAWRFGEAAYKTSKKLGGDYIDTGLQLLLELQEKGYGIVAIDAAIAANAQESK